MRSEVLIPLVAKIVERRVEDSLMSIPRIGPRGREGRHGKDFDIAEHEEMIISWIKENSLKFKDLTEEDINSLKGPRGRDGKDGRDGEKGETGITGRDGKSFNYYENKENISEEIRKILGDLKEELKLKFSDLSDEDRFSLKGPRGQRGKSGKDFSLEEHKEYFKSLIPTFDSLSNEQILKLKLKFSDLSEDEVFSLRGPRGPRGENGKDFTIEEHTDYFKSLIPTFDSLSNEQILKLKLKFSDLSFDEKAELKGSRGQRGKQGLIGPQGEKGDIGGIGPRGCVGPVGLEGRKGINGDVGPQGLPGKDAAEIIEAEIVDTKKVFYLKFTKNNGEEIVTNAIKFPSGKGVSNTFVTAVNYSSAASDSQGLIIPNVACNSGVYVGAAVYLDAGGIAYNAIATSIVTSNVIGIVQSKETTTSCTVRVLGVSPEIYSGLDTTKEYFLSDSVAGLISTAPITTSGNIVLKLGQPFSDKRFLVLKGIPSQKA